MSAFIEYPKVIHIGAQKITVKSAAEEAKWLSGSGAAKPVTQAAPIRPVHADVESEREPVVPVPTPSLKPEQKPKPDPKPEPSPKPKPR